MFTIVRRDTLLELRDHNESLQQANAHLHRTAEEAEASAAEAVRSRMSSLNRQLSEAGERNAVLATDLGQVQAELDKARAELAALEKDSRQAAALPPDGLAGCITVAVNTETSFGRPAGWDGMDYETRRQVIDREVAARKKTAAGKLSALLQVMQDTGLTGAGFGAALGSDLRAVENLGAPAGRITQHRLQIARDRVYASGLDLLALPPDAVLVLDKITMSVLGDPPDVVELTIYTSNEWDIR
jgi:hypothetical protein